LWTGSDTLREIEAEFAAMVERIDAQEQGTGPAAPPSE
jgi:hypothetical protein